MNSKIKHNYKAKLLYVLVFISAFVLLFSLNTIAVHADDSSSSGIYFEIDKNPIESVEISTDSDGNLMCGEIVQLSSTVYPENARETIIDTTYEIVDGNNLAKIDKDKLIVNNFIPVGSRIEVVSIVDGVRSENSLIFMVARTPVQNIEFTNIEDSLAVGGALKLNTVVYPDDATDKHVSYSIISDTNYMQVSYNGILSFNGKTIPEGELSVTVRATSTSDPSVYTEKTFTIYRPVVETVDATATLTEVNQQCAYSFDTDVPFLNEIFGNNAVKYSVNVDQTVAIIDVNGLLYVTANAPINSEIVVSMISYDEKTCYEHNLIVTPVYATDFTPVINTEPHTNISGNDYYLPGSSIAFDVVSYAPGNVTDTNKVFVLRVSDDSIAYVDGHTVIIRDVTEITTFNPHFEVVVYSEPNGLEQTFEIYVYIPLDSVVVSAKPVQLKENNTYTLTDLLEYSLAPNNATIESIRYELIGVDESIATIRDGNLIVNDNLPAGVVIVNLCLEINGIKSNVVEFEVYKPAHSITLDAEVNGEALSDTNLPVSSKNIADTVTLITKVDELASINASNIIVTKGAEYIDGEIRLIRVTDDDLAYFEFALKKNLSSVDSFDIRIKFYATQDGVVSGEFTMDVYIPNEDLQILPEIIERDSGNYTLTPIMLKSVTSRQWEFVLADDAISLGIKKISGESIWLPTNLHAGRSFTILYRSVESDPRWQPTEWKEVTYTIAKFDNFSIHFTNNSQNQTYKEGFNIEFNNDSAGHVIKPSAPQLWVGRSVCIDVKYGESGRSITDFGMYISKPDNQELVIYEFDNAKVFWVDDDTVRVDMDKEANGNSSVAFSIPIVDGMELYDLNVIIDAYNPLTESSQIQFNLVTKNNVRMAELLMNRDSIDRISGGVAALEFEVIGIDDEAVAIENNTFVIKSYTASKNQWIKCSYAGESYLDYNGVPIPNGCVSNIPLIIKTIPINKNGGSGGYDEIVAVSGMVGIGADEHKGSGMLDAVVGTRTGYTTTGFSNYIDCYGKVIADFNSLSSLDATWTPIKYKYYVGCWVLDAPSYATNAVEIITSYNVYYDKEFTVDLSIGWLSSMESGSTKFKYWKYTDLNGIEQYVYSKSATLKNLRTHDGDSVEIYACFKDEPSCVATGTLITLADGTQKPVEDLDGSEQLLVWNFYTGKFDSAPILFIDTHGEKEYTVTHLYFEDGTVVDIIDEHGFWDVDLNQYVYLTDKNALEYIGHRFNKQYTEGNGDLSYTSVRLVDAVNEQMLTNSYSPVTYSYLCYYVDGMLSVPSDTQGLTNYFEVDAENMQYDEAAMQADIELYGLFSYEDFKDEVPREIFDAVNGQYLKISMSKGLITEDYMAWLIESYSKYFYEGG